MIYFITVPSGRVKIGFALTNVKTRMRMLQAGCWEKMTLALVEHGGRRDERRWHNFFAKYRIRGDWFTLSDEIREHIDPETVAARKAMIRENYAEQTLFDEREQQLRAQY